MCFPWRSRIFTTRGTLHTTLEIRVREAGRHTPWTQSRGSRSRPCPLPLQLPSLFAVPHLQTLMPWACIGYGPSQYHVLEHPSQKLWVSLSQTSSRDPYHVTFTHRETGLRARKVWGAGRSVLQRDAPGIDKVFRSSAPASPANYLSQRRNWTMWLPGSTQRLLVYLSSYLQKSCNGYGSANQCTAESDFEEMALPG